MAGELGFTCYVFVLKLMPAMRGHALVAQPSNFVQAGMECRIHKLAVQYATTELGLWPYM